MVSTAEPVFLDRDGVINENRSDYVRRLDQWVPLPGVFEAIAKLCSRGHPVIVVTNQSGIARGLFGIEEMHRIHRRMNMLLEKAGGRFTGIRFCPHAPWDNCPCRKPGTGMIDSARRELALPGTGGWMVGDAATDIEMGRRAGLRTMLVLTGRGGAQLEMIRHDRGNLPDHVARDLPAAVETILAYSSE